jgi:hypothetical protein
VTCGREVAGQYCGNCGEQAPRAHDYSLARFLNEAIQKLSNLDGRVLRTFRSLLTRPGELATSYLAGSRRRFVGPVQTFLIANVIFFLLQLLSGFVPFTTPLNVQTSAFLWSGLARAMVSTRVSTPSPDQKLQPASGGAATVRPTYEDYARRFDETAHLQGKSLVMIMVPMFAILVWALYGRARRFYVEHLVFAFYVFAFFLIFMGVTTVLETMFLELANRFGIRLGSTAVEIATVFIAWIPVGIYLFYAARRTYAQGVAVTIVKSIALGFLIWPVITLYRCVLFFTTYLATS